MDIFRKLGGSVRVFEVFGPTSVSEFQRRSTQYLRSKTEGREGKHSFALASVGADLELFEIGLRVKRDLKNDHASVRLCNTENRTINAASFKKDRLSESGLECAYLEFSGHGHFAVTLACQDVDAFAARDLGKGRDMVVGMLPPKLARTMVNLASGSGNAAVYDPFCGLGTVLIEAADLGFRKLFGSDIEPRMEASTRQALAAVREKPPASFEFAVSTLDARKVATNRAALENSVIVTEGYLGEIMGKRTVTPEKIAEQKRHLVSIYRDFFRGLRSSGFRNSIVMCLPFWDQGGTFSFFEEFYEILKEFGYYSEKLLPERVGVFPTKFGSLLYRRTDQTVGREIVRIIPGYSFDLAGSAPKFEKKFGTPKHSESFKKRPPERPTEFPKRRSK